MKLFFIRLPNETLEEMLKGHETPYASRNDAIEDANRYLERKQKFSVVEVNTKKVYSGRVKK